MVEDIISDLGINEEGAREARKSPEQFYINYDTYKLLKYQWVFWSEMILVLCYI